MNIDHICIAVRRLEKAVPRFCELFDYRVKTEPVTNTRQQVTVQFVEKAGSLDVKFIEPAGDDSPLWRSLRGGEGLHHVCFRTEDVETGVETLKGRGARVLAPPQPGEAFDEASIAFLFAGMGLNVELIDTDRRRGLLGDEQ